MEATRHLPELAPGDPVTFTCPVGWVDTGTRGVIVEREGENRYRVELGSHADGKTLTVRADASQLARA